MFTDETFISNDNYHEQSGQYERNMKSGIGGHVVRYFIETD